MYFGKSHTLLCLIEVARRLLFHSLFAELRRLIGTFCTSRRLLGTQQFAQKLKSSTTCSANELHQTSGGYYRVMECSRKISMVPILMYFFSAFHFCYCHLCTGFSLLSKDVNVRLCQFSEITTTLVNQGCAIQIPGSI